MSIRSMLKFHPHKNIFLSFFLLLFNTDFTPHFTLHFTLHFHETDLRNVENHRFSFEKVSVVQKLKELADRIREQ